MTKAPLTRGTVPDYLREAEARGAVPAGFQVLGLEPLNGGRTGARGTASPRRWRGAVVAERRHARASRARCVSHGRRCGPRRQ